MGSNKKHKGKLSYIVSILRDNWFILSLVLPAAGTAIYGFLVLPKRVDATEIKVKEVEDRTNDIESYIAEQRKVQELIKKAPDGWLWDTRSEKFVKNPNGK